MVFLCGCATHELRSGHAFAESSEESLELTTLPGGVLASTLDTERVIAISSLNHDTFYLMQRDSDSINANILLVTVTRSGDGRRWNSVSRALELKKPGLTKWDWNWDNRGFFYSYVSGCEHVYPDGRVSRKPWIWEWVKKSRHPTARLYSTFSIDEQVDLALVLPGRDSADGEDRAALATFKSGKLTSTAICDGVRYSLGGLNPSPRQSFLELGNDEYLVFMPGGTIWKWSLARTEVEMISALQIPDDVAMSIQWAPVGDLDRKTIVAGNENVCFLVSIEGHVTSPLDVKGLRYMEIRGLSCSQGMMVGIGNVATARAPFEAVPAVFLLSIESGIEISAVCPDFVGPENEVVLATVDVVGRRVLGITRNGAIVVGVFGSKDSGR